MACCLPCFNCAITQAVRCASCYASAPYVHGETACAARAMKERSPVTQCIGVTDVKKKPTSKQPKNGSCIGEASIVSQIINDLHDGRAGAELRPNVQRSRITSPVRPFKCWSAGDVRPYISTRPCRARPEMEKSMRVSFSSVCRLLSRCEIRHGGIGDRSGSPGSPPVNQLIAAQLCL